VIFNEVKGGFMQKVKTAVRWSAVFLTLSIFTLQALSVIGFGGPDTALAQSANSEQFKKDDKFLIVDDEDEHDDGREDRDHDRTNRIRNICALNQSQFDALADELDVRVKTKSVDGKTVSYAVVKKTRGVNKNTIYDIIGVEPRGKRCKIVKQHNYFFLFMLPGVS
jgi:hypothetical protein